MHPIANNRGTAPSPHPTCPAVIAITAMKRLLERGRCHHRNAAPPSFCQCCGSRLLWLASAVARVCCGSCPLWLASMFHARHGDIAEIEKIVHENPIAPFSKTIRDGTTRLPPCVSPCIVDNAAGLELQKMR